MSFIYGTENPYSEDATKSDLIYAITILKERVKQLEAAHKELKGELSRIQSLYLDQK